MASDDLILNALDVIEIRSDTDLIITSNSHIKLSTTNILVNYIPLESYIRKLLSPATVLSGVTSHSNVHTDYGAPIANITGLDQLNNNDEDTEMDIDTVFCRGNFADSSYVLTPDSVNVQHYINISAANNIYFKHESFDDNILFHKYDQSPSGSSLQTLKDYIYSVVHAIERPGSVPPQIFDPIDYRKNLEHLGNFSGRKIICKKITTNETELRDIEPVLTFDSKTAINFYTDTSSNAGSMGIGSKIYFGNDASSGTDTSLDQLIYDQRSVGLAIAANFTPGLDIIMDVTTITETPRNGFPYDIMFNIYEHPDVYDPVLYPLLLENYMAIPSGSANTFKVPNVLLDTDVPSIPNFTFTNLKPGKFYTVVARTTNLQTNTVSYVFVEPPNQPTIKHVEIIEIVVVTEYSIRISFKGHRTQVSDWTSASNRLVYFHTGIGADVDDDDTGVLTITEPIPIPPVTQNLSIPIPASMPTLYLNTTLNYIIPTTSAGGVTTTDPMEVDVISKHDDLPTSTFIMRKSAYLTPYSFTAPLAPINFSLNSFGDLFSWTKTTNTRIRDIFYDIYREATPNILLNSTILLNVSSTNVYTNVLRNTIYSVPNVCYSGIYPGNYKIRAYNSFNLLGPFSNIVQITDIIVTRPVISFYQNAQLRVSYTVSNNNGSFTIASDQTISSVGSSYFFTDAKTFVGTSSSYTAYVDVTDAFGLKIRSDDSYPPFIVRKATISVTDLSFANIARTYECRVSIDRTKSHNITTLIGISSSLTPESEMVHYATNAATGIIQFKLNDTGPGVESVAGRAYITGTDTYGFITNTVSKSITISRPNITIGPLTYVPVSTRTFEATITSTSDTIATLVRGTGSNCTITIYDTTKIRVVVNNSISNIDISYNVQLVSILGFSSIFLLKSETISVNLVSLTASVFSVTSSTYDFEIDYTGTDVTVTIAVSTSDTSFTGGIASSIHTISYNEPETGTVSGTVSPVTIPASDQTYYLWGEVKDNQGFSSSYVYLNIYDTITIDLGLLRATRFSITNSSYDFEIEFPDTYSTITIAVSTSDTAFEYLPSSEHIISYNGPETGTVVSETGTISSLTILSEQSYYLWGKVIDNLGFSSSYVYLNESDKIVVNATETIYMVNNLDRETIVKWTNKFGYRTPYEFNTGNRQKHFGGSGAINDTMWTHFTNSLQSSDGYTVLIRYTPETDSMIYFPRVGNASLSNMRSADVTHPITTETGIDLVRGITVISVSGQKYNFTNILQYFTENVDEYLYAVVLNGPTIDIYKKGVNKWPIDIYTPSLDAGPHVTVNAD